MLDIHQQDSTRIFSDEPGGFDELSAATRPAIGTLELEETDVRDAGPSSETPVKGRRKGRKETKEEDNQSTATESGPDSPETESADEQLEPEEEGTSAAVEGIRGEGLEWESECCLFSKFRFFIHFLF